MKILPRSIIIHVKKGVQVTALQKLAERIIQHRGSLPTQLISRRTRKGRFTNFQWISAPAFSKMVKDVFFKRLLKLTRKRKRAVTIIVKQLQTGGAIHEMWAKNHSLL